jgi:ArsR family transcriptional regulator
MSLAFCLDTLSLLGDESRLRLCALLRERELCVTDLVRVTGIAQSRVSTHLGRLRDAGYVHDRRHGTQSFYALAFEGLPTTAKAILDDVALSDDATLRGDRDRLAELEAERREGLPDSVADDMERFYSPGRSWNSLAVGLASLLRLGDILDLGSGDGAAASVIAPYCRSLVCIDQSPRLVESAKERLSRYEHVSVRVGDAHALDLPPASFDAVLVFHTLTYAEDPSRVLAECARVLRPNGRLVILCLDAHAHFEVTSRYGERHAGFSPHTLHELLAAAGLEVKSAEVGCREAKKPHLRVVLAIAEKASPLPTKA